MLAPMREALDTVFRQESGVVLAALIASLGDFDLAEDAFSDAVEAALVRWPRDGVPERPAAWLTTTARRRALDRLRHERMRAGKAADLRTTELVRRNEEAELEDAMNAPLPDERLRLMFTCCHPALAEDAQVALTLRTLGGLSTPEVAAAFLVPKATMAKRLVRAKKKIREARIPYRIPDAEALPERLDAVLAALYLIFNRGWSQSEGTKAGELCAEGIRLVRILADLLPGEPEVHGLLALMLLHDARYGARVVDGVWVPLERQDRSRWKWPQIGEGLRMLTLALRHKRVGPYQLQACISALHAQSRGPDDVPWSEIAELYQQLERLAPTPVVTLNRAVALGREQGAAAGLALLDRLDPARLDDYQPWHLARADLLERAGRRDEAATALDRALALSSGGPERRHLELRVAELKRG